MVTKIVGILNVTPDSFSDGGKFNSFDAALNHAKQMLAEGVDVIDIGAESTRPQAIKISAEEEWRRLEKILPAIISEVKNFTQKTGKKISVSIDSYHFETIEKAWAAGIDVVNDVSGLVDEKIINFIAEKNLITILMHSLSVPANPKLVVNPYLNINKEIIDWAQEKIAYLLARNVKKSQLIFDPGIGFGKNQKQSIRILKSIDSYRALGLPLYIGHSKKRFLDELQIDGDRTQKTLAVSKYLIEKKVDFLRVHDVKAHVELERSIEAL